jgi:hypothetical protein
LTKLFYYINPSFAPKFPPYASPQPRPGAFLLFQVIEHLFPSQWPLQAILNICSVCGIIPCMTVELVLAVLIFANTIVIIATLSVIIFVLVRMGMETAKFTDIENSFTELTKIIDQQSRLLEFISRRSINGSN